MLALTPLPLSHRRKKVLPSLSGQRLCYRNMGSEAGAYTHTKQPELQNHRHSQLLNPYSEVTAMASLRNDSSAWKWERVTEMLKG